MKRKILFAVCLCVTCGFWFWAGIAQADAQRRAEKLEPPITVGELPGDFTDISWAIERVPDGVVAVASPERIEVAGNILASILSDPLFRHKYHVLFEHYMAIGHEREEASAMAKGHAAQVAYAFADALVFAGN